MEPAAAQSSGSGYYPGISALASRSGPYQLVVTNGNATLQSFSFGHRRINALNEPVALLPKPVTENWGDSHEASPVNPGFPAPKLYQTGSSPLVNTRYLDFKPQLLPTNNDVNPQVLSYPVPKLLDPGDDPENESPLSIVIRKLGEDDFVDSKEQLSAFEFVKHQAIPELKQMIAKLGDDNWRIRFVEWVNFQDEYGFSPLMNASRHGALPVIPLLIRLGATPLREYGSTAFHEALSGEKSAWGATRYQVLETMLVALKQKAPGELAEAINKKLNPFQAGHFEKVLREMKGKLKLENTALHQLMEGGNGIEIDELLTLVQLLVEYGADPMIENGKGRTVFGYVHSERFSDRQKIFQSIINNLSVDALNRIRCQIARLPSGLQIELQALINKRTSLVKGNACAVRPHQAVSVSGRLPTPQSLPMPSIRVPPPMSQPHFSTGEKRGDEASEWLPRGRSTVVPRSVFSESVWNRPVAPVRPMFLSSQSLQPVPDSSSGVMATASAEQDENQMAYTRQIGQGLNTPAVRTLPPVMSTNSFADAFINPAVTSTQSSASSMIYESGHFSEMVSDFGQEAPSGGDPELNALWDDLFRDEPLPACNPTVPGLQEGMSLVSSEGKTSATPSRPFLQQAPMSGSDVYEQLATASDGLPLAGFMPGTSYDSFYSGSNTGTIQKMVDTSFSLMNDPLKIDHTAFEKGSAPESLEFSSDSDSEVPANANSRFPGNVNCYEGRSLTDRQAVLQARRLSELESDVSEPAAFMPGIQTPQYEPPVSTVCSADHSNHNDYSLLPVMVANDSQPRRRGRPRNVEAVAGVERTPRRRSGRQGIAIIDFIISELDKGESQRVKGLRWYDRSKGIFIKERKANDELAGRWGGIKGNDDMNYEKFARAIRNHYSTDSSGRRIEHLIYGPDGTNEGRQRSDYYRIYWK